MAIRRCPYCKAIIDESQKYCNNCGTQLLFPEDESVEENIPGEKIVDEDFKEEEKAEPPLEFLDTEEQKEEIDLEEVLEGGGVFPGEVKPEESRVPPKRKVRTADRPREEIIPEEGPEPPLKNTLEEEAEPEELHEKTGDEEDKEDSQEEVDISKMKINTPEEIARLIAVLEKKQKKSDLADEDEKILEPLERKSRDNVPSESRDDLPPWAEIVDKAPLSVRGEEGGKEKPVAEDVLSFVPGDTFEFKEEIYSHVEQQTSGRTRMGIPESMTREKILIPKEEAEIMEGLGEPEILEPEVQAAGKRPIRRPRLRSRLGVFAKIRAILFDLIFISIIWLVSVWLASRLMAVRLAKLISMSVVSVALFYGVLLVAYFFLFLFFLGETLGDRVVSPKD
jgi:hypothetical protein